MKRKLLMTLALAVMLVWGGSALAWEQDGQSVTDAYSFSTSDGWSNQQYGPGIDDDHHSKYKKNPEIGDWAGVNDVTLEIGYKYRFSYYLKKGVPSASVSVYLRQGTTNVSELIDAPYGGGGDFGDAYKFTSDEIIGDAPDSCCTI